MLFALKTMLSSILILIKYFNPYSTLQLKQGKLEQKLAMIPLLYELGLNAEKICAPLELDFLTVRKILEQNQ